MNNDAGAAQLVVLFHNPFDEAVAEAGGPGKLKWWQLPGLVMERTALWPYGKCSPPPHPPNPLPLNVPPTLSLQIDRPQDR